MGASGGVASGSPAVAQGRVDGHAAPAIGFSSHAPDEGPWSASARARRGKRRRRFDRQDLRGSGIARPLIDALARSGLHRPTPIQAASIPAQLEGRDLLGVAQTGTGKTAAFGLPMVQAILGLQGRPSPKTCRALILAPTRELAVQIEASLRSYAAGRLSTQLVLGGMSRSAQVRGIARGVDVVIATPGRIVDLVDGGELRLDETRFVVLDEADRMLDMGFIEPVRSLVAKLHPRRQSLLFSATMPSEVEMLTREFLRDPVRVEVAPQATVVPKIEQSVELVATAEKRARLLALLGDPEVAAPSSSPAPSAGRTGWRRTCRRTGSTPR